MEVELMSLLSKFAGGFGLVMAGRWLIRAQVVASVLRTGGIILIFLGFAAALGIVSFDFGAIVDLVDLVRNLTAW